MTTISSASRSIDNATGQYTYDGYSYLPNGYNDKIEQQDIKDIEEHEKQLLVLARIVSNDIKRLKKLLNSDNSDNSDFDRLSKLGRVDLYTYLVDAIKLLGKFYNDDNIKKYHHRGYDELTSNTVVYFLKKPTMFKIYWRLAIKELLEMPFPKNLNSLCCEHMGSRNG